MNHQELQDLFFKEIPITQHMSLHVAEADGQQVVIQFGLAANKNHKGTAFGGSQYTACALACYGLFLVGIREEGYETNNIVIGEGKINYFAPVTSNYEVRAKWNSKEERTQFFETLKLKKKARVLLSAEIISNNNVCTKFEGSFVAIL